MKSKDRKIARTKFLGRLEGLDPELAKEVREMWAEEAAETAKKLRVETADIRSVAAKDRAAYATRRKEVIANGMWLPPTPSQVWWISDETEERRVAEQVREEMHLRERFEALAACF
jgi:hypothetical protein